MIFYLFVSGKENFEIFRIWFMMLNEVQHKVSKFYCYIDLQYTCICLIVYKNIKLLNVFELY